MAKRETMLATSLALSLLAGCHAGPRSYLYAFVAANSDASPALMVVDHDDGTPYISAVEIEKGTRGDRYEIGSQGSCLPSVPGRLWCAYELGLFTPEGEQDEQMAVMHESRRVSTFDLIADDDDFVANSGGRFTLDQIEFRGSQPVMRTSDRSLVVGGPDKYFAVHPGTFEVSDYALQSSSETTYGGEIIVAMDVYAKVSGVLYGFSEDHRIEQRASETDAPTPLAAADTYDQGFFVLTDGYASTREALVVEGPKSFFVVSIPPSETRAEGPHLLTRVAVEDGKVLWQRQLPAGSIHAIAAHGEVLGIALKTTPWSANQDGHTIIDAKLLGVSTTTGADVWTWGI